MLHYPLNLDCLRPPRPCPYHTNPDAISPSPFRIFHRSAHDASRPRNLPVGDGVAPCKHRPNSKAQAMLPLACCPACVVNSPRWNDKVLRARVGAHRAPRFGRDAGAEHVHGCAAPSMLDLVKSPFRVVPREHDRLHVLGPLEPCAPCGHTATRLCARAVPHRPRWLYGWFVHECMNSEECARRGEGRPSKVGWAPRNAQSYASRVSRRVEGRCEGLASLAQVVFESADLEPSVAQKPGHQCRRYNATKARLLALRRNTESPVVRAGVHQEMWRERGQIRREEMASHAEFVLSHLRDGAPGFCRPCACNRARLSTTLLRSSHRPGSTSSRFSRHPRTWRGVGGACVPSWRPLSSERWAQTDG